MRALRWPAVREKVGLSRTTVWRLEQDGRFPRRRRLSSGTVAWLSDEIDEWLRHGDGHSPEVGELSERRP